MNKIMECIKIQLNTRLPIIMLLLIFIPMTFLYTFVKLNIEYKMSFSILYMIAVWCLDIYLEKKFYIKTKTD